MPRGNRQPPSRHRLHLAKMGRKKSSKPVAAPKPAKGQSLLGSMSIFFALASLFLMGVEAMLKLQAAHGASAALDYLRTYLLPGQLFGAILGFACGVFSFGLSSKRQRNAVLGLILNVTLIGGWFVLRTYLK
ncbi:MAG: hypothetical protein K2R98_03455 [Gemmataceae bacterium]|nr:hypothetical protein [Gemmataceae bacterium]